MLTKERHQAITRVLEQNQFVTIHEIVSLLKSSEATIRRDFTWLARERKLRRVRGGAESIAPRPTPRPFFPESSFAYRTGLLQEKKRMIAKKAVSLCREEETIIIDGGSTTYQMVEFLKGAHLKIITNSFAIAEYLVHHSQNTIVISGGVVYPESQLILSPFDNDGSNNYYAAKVFMGVGGIDEKGATNSDMLLIQKERMMIEQGKELIVLADSSKFEKRKNLRLCGFDKIHTIITDSSISAETRRFIKSVGVNLLVV